MNTTEDTRPWINCSQSLPPEGREVEAEWWEGGDRPARRVYNMALERVIWQIKEPDGRWVRCGPPPVRWRELPGEAPQHPAQPLSPGSDTPRSDACDYDCYCDLCRTLERELNGLASTVTDAEISNAVFRGQPVAQIRAMIAREVAAAKNSLASETELREHAQAEAAKWKEEAEHQKLSADLFEASDRASRAEISEMVRHGADLQAARDTVSNERQELTSAREQIERLEKEKSMQAESIRWYQRELLGASADRDRLKSAPKDWPTVEDVKTVVEAWGIENLFETLTARHNARMASQSERLEQAGKLIEKAGEWVAMVDRAQRMIGVSEYGRSSLLDTLAKLQAYGR
jgi:hypothetical protein